MERCKKASRASAVFAVRPSDLLPRRLSSSSFAEIWIGVDRISLRDLLIIYTSLSLDEVRSTFEPDIFVYCGI